MVNRKLSVHIPSSLSLSTHIHMWELPSRCPSKPLRTWKLYFLNSVFLQKGNSKSSTGKTEKLKKQCPSKGNPQGEISSHTSFPPFFCWMRNPDSGQQDRQQNASIFLLFSIPCLCSPLSVSLFLRVSLPPLWFLPLSLFALTLVVPPSLLPHYITLIHPHNPSHVPKPRISNPKPLALNLSHSVLLSFLSRSALKLLLLAYKNLVSLARQNVRNVCNTLKHTAALWPVKSCVPIFY